MPELEARLDAARYDDTVYYLTQHGVADEAYRSASLDDLADLIRRAYSIRVQNDVVRQQVEGAINNVVRLGSRSTLFVASEALTSRLFAALGLPTPNPASPARAARNRSFFGSPRAFEVLSLVVQQHRWLRRVPRLRH